MEQAARTEENLRSGAYTDDTIVDAVNRTNSDTFELSTLLVTQSGGILTSTQAAKSCSAGGSGCWSCLNTCAYQNDKAASTFALTGTPGSFDLTLTPPAVTPTHTSINIGSFDTPGYTATVLQTGPYTFTINTYNLIGGAPATPAANIFKNTAIYVIFHYSPFTTI